MLTQDDLNMIKERAEKVTHGPWYADAEFITHAREDIPRLVAEVERLRQAIREIHDIAEDFNLENAEVRLRVNSLPVRGHLHVIYSIAAEAITND